MRRLSHIICGSVSCCRSRLCPHAPCFQQCCCSASATQSLRHCIECQFPAYACCALRRRILPKKKPISGRRQVTSRADTAAAVGLDQTAATSYRLSSSSIGRTLSKEMSGLSLTTEPSGVSSCRSGGTAVTAAMAAAAAAPRVLLPDPYMKLQHVNGFTGRVCALLCSA